MQPANKPSSTVPPYVAFRSVINFLDWLREVGVPSRLDRSFWGKKFSGSYGTQLMAALRFLQFIDAEDRPTQDLERMVKDRAQAKLLLKGRLQACYAQAMGKVNLERATRSELNEAFSVFGLERATLRKAITFFVHAAKYAEIPLSKHILSSTKERSVGSSTRKKKVIRPNDDIEEGFIAINPRDFETAKAQSSSLLWGLFQRLPKPGVLWPMKDRMLWLQTLQNVFDLEYTTEPEDTIQAQEPPPRIRPAPRGVPRSRPTTSEGITDDDVPF